LFLIGGALAGLIAGLLAGGKVVRLTEIRFRWPLVVVVALLVKELGVDSPLGATPIARIVYPAALAVLIAWTVWHRDRLPGIEIFAAGNAMNLLVIAANLGRMPVSVDLARRGPPQLIELGAYGQYVLMGRGTNLDWLGDWIQLPGTLGRILPQAYSPGDIVACFGIMIAVFLAIRPIDAWPRRDYNSLI
jgi:hypothetical protein